MAISRPATPAFNRVGFVILCCAVFAVSMFVASFLFRPIVVVERSTNGFDFRNVLKAESESGPRIGDRIDLTQLKGQDGRSLGSMIGERPVLIAAVDPQCKMCKIAADQIIYVSNAVAEVGVPYYFASFTSSVSAPEFFAFTDSAPIHVPSFFWPVGTQGPPERLFRMTVPSHMLIDRSGTIIRLWPGSSNEKTVRDRMANQIIADTRVVLSSVTH